MVDFFYKKVMIPFLFQSLEQEKYLLRKKLDSATEEYDLRVGELQADIANLRQILQVKI